MKVQSPDNELVEFSELLEGENQTMIIERLKYYQQQGHNLHQLWIKEPYPIHYFQSMSAPEKPIYDLHHFLTEAISSNWDQVVEWLLSQNISPDFHHDEVFRNYSQFSNSVLEPISCSLHTLAWNFLDQDEQKIQAQYKILESLFKHGASLQYPDLGTRQLPMELFWNTLGQGMELIPEEMEQGWKVLKIAAVYDPDGSQWYSLLQQKAQKNSKQYIPDYFPWEQISSQQYEQEWRYVLSEMERQLMIEQNPLPTPVRTSPRSRL